MSVGFGFSAGDFIAALKIVAEVVDALRESGESSTECRQLLSSLYDLETALIHVKRLELDDSQADQLNALKHAALQCRTTIDEFMRKIHKYQPHLHSAASSRVSALKSSWYKIKWAVCRKEDLQKFKADLNGHTEAINLLMASIQLKKMTIEATNQSERHSSLKSIIQDSFSKTMQKLVSISDAITASVSNSKKLLEVTIRTAQTDCKIFGIVLDIQDMLRRNIVPQVLLSQPIQFIDVLGMPAPFHLEFIRSREAFVAVLRSNMKGNEAAIRRIDRGDFAVSDIATNMDVDLSRPWNMCFRPGQKADMSMILKEHGISSSICPSCKMSCSGQADEDIKCDGCGLTFRRLTELQELDQTLEESFAGTTDSSQISDKDRASKAPNLKVSSSKRKRQDDIAQELSMYRKVRLRLQMFQPVQRPDSMNEQVPVVVEKAMENDESVLEMSKLIQVAHAATRQHIQRFNDGTAISVGELTGHTEDAPVAAVTERTAASQGAGVDKLAKHMVSVNASANFSNRQPGSSRPKTRKRSNVWSVLNEEDPPHQSPGASQYPYTIEQRGQTTDTLLSLHPSDAPTFDFYLDSNGVPYDPSLDHNIKDADWFTLPLDHLFVNPSNTGTDSILYDSSLDQNTNHPENFTLPNISYDPSNANMKDTDWFTLPLDQLFTSTNSPVGVDPSGTSDIDLLDILTGAQKSSQ